MRVERQGSGNGRVYQIIFQATNSAGASCVGQINVGVPKNKNSTPVDSGLRIESMASGSNCDAQPANNVPFIYSEAVTTGREAQPYQYQVQAHDSDQDSLDYSLWRLFAIYCFRSLVKTMHF